MISRKSENLNLEIPYPPPPSLADIEKFLENNYGSSVEPFLIYIGPGNRNKSVSYFVTFDGQLFVRDTRTVPVPSRDSRVQPEF